jgi:hypothetical protein
MSLSTDTAVAEVVALTRELGLGCVPEVLADRSNLVLLLAPHRIVARVAMATSMVRVGMDWLRREVEISSFLDARGVFVTRPSPLLDAGPHERGGFVISFWELEDTVENLDGALAGARLARAHLSLRDFSRERVPEWGAWTEARAVLDRARASLSKEEAARVLNAWNEGERIVQSSSARSASIQAVHGDAHLRNVLATRRGPVWTDWEDAFLGPVEWDIACLRSRAELFGEEREAIDAACAAYDAPSNADLVCDLMLVRNLQVISWLAIFAERQPELLPRMRDRISKLPLS